LNTKTIYKINLPKNKEKDPKKKADKNPITALRAGIKFLNSRHKKRIILDLELQEEDTYRPKKQEQTGDRLILLQKATAYAYSKTVFFIL